MRKIELISIFLISILLSSIILISFSNVNQFMIAIEYNEEEGSSGQENGNSSTQNIIEEEEQHLNEQDRIFPKLKIIRPTQLAYFAKYAGSVCIDIITPPPLF